MLRNETEVTMITFRTELQLVKDATVLDVWQVFCKWRGKSKYSTRVEKTWFSQNSSFLKTEAVALNSAHVTSTVKTLFDEVKKLMLIQYIQNEGKKTFTTTIIMNSNFSSPILSYTMEESPLSMEEFELKKNNCKPGFFTRMESFVDKKYVPCDFRGMPLSFTPSIFVSKNIPDDCYKYLCEKYEHTANIRLDRKKDRPKAKFSDSDQDCIAKRSSYFITDKKNMDFVDWKITWDFVAQSMSLEAKEKIENVRVLGKEVLALDKKKTFPKRKVFFVKKKIFHKVPQIAMEF